MNVCVVGRGKVGRALHRGLSDAGVASALARAHPLSVPRARHTVYLLAVPDARIGEVATGLAARLDARASALHCAGARGADELAPLAARGVSVGVFHPLVSFASAARGASLRGATFTSFGDPRAIRLARSLAQKLGARCVVLPAAPGPAYHAAAALVANGSAALAHLGARLLVQLGFEPSAAERALSALLASVAENVALVGVPGALTGPVVRGDLATVERHLRALARLDRRLARAYADVQPIVVASALAAGLDPRLGRKLLRAARQRNETNARVARAPRS